MEIIAYLAYLVSSVLFIYGIKQLSSPKTARNGNFLAALGMFLAIVITLFDKKVLTYEYIIIGFIIGGIAGAWMALKSSHDRYAANGRTFKRLWRRSFPIGCSFRIQ
jgi:NAD(P) transhydrogenase subunit beta